MEKTITKEHAQNALIKIYDVIQHDMPDIGIKEHEDQAYSKATFDENGKPLIIIGTKNLNRTNNKETNKHAAYLLTTPFHELKHILQFTKETRDPWLRRTNKTVRQIALETMINQYFPEHYMATYFNAPIEIAAELYGLQESKAFFDNHKYLLDNVDFGKALTAAITDKRIIPRWYAPRNPVHPITDITQAENALKKNLETASDPKKRHAYPLMADIENPYRYITPAYPLMQDMKRDQSFISKLKEAGTLHDQQLLLIDAIRQYDHDYFYGNEDILPFTKKYMAYFNDSQQGISAEAAPRKADKPVLVEPRPDYTIPDYELPSCMQDDYNSMQDSNDGCTYQ